MFFVEPIDADRHQDTKTPSRIQAGYRQDTGRIHPATHCHAIFHELPVVERLFRDTLMSVEVFKTFLVAK